MSAQYEILPLSCIILKTLYTPNHYVICSNTNRREAI
jgi:hypothetical protein